MSNIPLHGQVALSGSAQPLSTTALTSKSWILKAPTSNAGPAYMGGPSVSSSNGHQMDPGDEFEYELRYFQGEPFYPLQPSDIYVVGGSGDKVTWLASP